MTLQSDLETIDRWLREHAPRTHSSLHPGLTRDAVAALAKRFDVEFLPELDQLLMWHNGAASSNVAWQLWPGLHFIGSADMHEVWSMRCEIGEELPELWNPQWIPIAADHTGNYLVLDHSRSGQRGNVFFVDMVDGDYSDLRWPSLHTLVERVVNATTATTALDHAVPVIENETLRWRTG